MYTDGQTVYKNKHEYYLFEMLVIGGCGVRKFAYRPISSNSSKLHQ